MKKRVSFSLIALLLAMLMMLCSCDTNLGDINIPGGDVQTEQPGNIEQPNGDSNISYTGVAYTEQNGNIPVFSDAEKTTVAYEKYSELDNLGRCGIAIAVLGQETMPAKDEERGSINNVTPSGWVQAKYDIVDGKYLYNRAHMIGWQLSAENDNEKNLITGTRYFNVEGMLPFENMVADYIRETNNHVAYRVTPVYEGNNLVCSGVIMEAWSIEDNGEGICFNVLVHNVQPGIQINYATGESWLTGETPPETTEPETKPEYDYYVLNTSSKKIHYPDCSYAEKLNEANKSEYTGDLQELIDSGYTTCGVCKPE